MGWFMVVSVSTDANVAIGCTEARVEECLLWQPCGNTFSAAALEEGFLPLIENVAIGPQDFGQMAISPRAEIIPSRVALSSNGEIGLPDEY